ncbi:hypothetical protein HPG69_018983, partial [Diceros bicornis minor]
MISQPMTNETFVVLTPNGITFLQTESPKPAYQSQGSLKKQLKVEVKVLGVQSSLAANILSSVFALVGFILLSVKLAALDPALWKCALDKQHTPTEYYYDPYENNDCPKAKAILVGTVSVMLICTLLEFCLAVLAALVWWEQSCSDFP